MTCEVTAVKDNGLEVKLVDHDLTTFIRRSDLSRDRSEQRPDRFGVGEKFDAVVTQVDAKARKVSVSIKALEIAEEKEAVAQYGSTDSGASLGDILGAALNKAKGEEATRSEAARPSRSASAPPRARPSRSRARRMSGSASVPETLGAARGAQTLSKAPWLSTPKA